MKIDLEVAFTIVCVGVDCNNFLVFNRRGIQLLEIKMASLLELLFSPIRTQTKCDTDRHQMWYHNAVTTNTKNPKGILATTQLVLVDFSHSGVISLILFMFLEISTPKDRWRLWTYKTVTAHRGFWRHHNRFARKGGKDLPDDGAPLKTHKSLRCFCVLVYFPLAHLKNVAYFRACVENKRVDRRDILRTKV